MNDKEPLLSPSDQFDSHSRKADEKTVRRNRRLGGPLAFLLVVLIFVLFRRNRISSHIPVPPLPKEFLKQCNDLLEVPAGTFADRLSKLAEALASDSENGRDAVWIAEPGPSTEYYIGAFGPGVWHPSERPFLVSVHPSSEKGKANVTLLTATFEQGRAQLIPLPVEVEGQVTWVSWNEDESPYRKLIDHLGRTGDIAFDAQVRQFIAEGMEAAASRKRMEWNSSPEGQAELNASFERNLEEMKKLKTETKARKEAGLPPAPRKAYSEVSDLERRPAERHPLERRVELIRERKDEREIGLLRCANQLTLHGIRKTRSRMHFGITEKETSRILSEELAKLGLAEGGGLVLFGENAALPHGSGTNRKLGKEDFALIDAGGKWGGYVADITRTFALPGSKIPKTHLEVWETVRQAQHAPFERLRDSNVSNPPLLGSLDVTARGVITTNMAALNAPSAHDSSTSPDYTYLTHRLGHGIGLEGHEGPYLVQGPLGSKEVQTGHVFSLEPGVYIPRIEGEKGLNGLGVRLEDCFAVSADEDGRLGGEWLSGPVSKWGDV